VHTWRHDPYRAHPTVPGPSAARTVPGPDPGPTGHQHGHDRFRIGRVEFADDPVVPTAHQHLATGAPAGAGRELRGVPRSRRQPNARRVTDDFPGAPHAQALGIRRGGGRHRAHPGRRHAPMTALTIAAAVIIVAAGAIIQFRTAAVTTESAGGGADADASPWPRTPPAGWEDQIAARGPSSAGPVAPFQIRPAAVQADLPDQPASISGQPAGADQGTPLSPSPMSPAPAAPATPTDTATEPADQPLPSADQPARSAVDGVVAAPAQEPAAPAPVAAAQTPPPQSPAPDPAPTLQPTAATPPSPTTTPEAAPPRGKSADHLPEHANGGVGNTDHPKPSNPGSGPKD
jgi:hypothetical protein